MQYISVSFMKSKIYNVSQCSVGDKMSELSSNPHVAMETLGVCGHVEILVEHLTHLKNLKRVFIN